MKSTKEKFLRKLQEELPEYCSTADLASLKILGGLGSISKDRRQKRGIPFIQFSKCRVVYLKEDVIKYIENNFFDLDK